MSRVSSVFIKVPFVKNYGISVIKKELGASSVHVFVTFSLGHHE